MKRASDKLNESMVNEMINTSNTGKSILLMSRKELRELNNSRGESDPFIVPKVLDVSDIMRARRTINRSRNSTFIKNESIAAKKDATFTVDNRDFVTPDNDSPINEIKRKLIEEELNRSVTRRHKGQRKIATNREGTPLAGEEPTESDLNSTAIKPKKLNAFDKEPEEDSESVLELPAVEPISKTLDDVRTDDEVDSDLDIDEEANLTKYPKWSKRRREFSILQRYINQDLIDGLFCQNFQPDAKELFPNSTIVRRRSTMWELN